MCSCYRDSHCRNSPLLPCKMSVHLNANVLLYVVSDDDFCKLHVQPRPVFHLYFLLGYLFAWRWFNIGLRYESSVPFLFCKCTELNPFYYLLTFNCLLSFLRSECPKLSLERSYSGFCREVPLNSSSLEKVSLCGYISLFKITNLWVRLSNMDDWTNKLLK